MQQSSTKFLTATPVCHPAKPAKTARFIERFIAASHIRPEDHVMVIGRKLSEHLAALAHTGCRSATGADPASLYMRKDKADVVWMTDVSEIDAQTASAVSRLADARLIAIELVASASLGKLQPFLLQLREMGYVWQSFRLVSDRPVVMAQRPEWLQWVA